MIRHELPICGVGTVPEATVTVNDCVAASPPGSATRAVTPWLPTCADVGVQAIWPLLALIAMPAGACVSA